jgi:hypothetical protein
MGIGKRRQYNALNKPMTDFSSAFSLTTLPYFSFRVLSSNSSAISLIVSRSFWKSLFSPVGSFRSIGRTGPIKKTKWDNQEVSAAPMASNTSTTEGYFPSSDPKSWPKPAIPIESSLESKGLLYKTISLSPALTKYGSS